MIPAPLKPALFVQLFYVGLVITWQLIGVALKMLGGRALGPTASLALAGQALVVAVLFVVALRRSPALFAAMSVCAAIAIGINIAGALSDDSALWPSDAARYLSVSVNSVGIVGTILAVVGFARWRGARDLAEGDES